MMNLGITNLTNPYLWSSFGPYAWTSNYGYETQMNVFPSSMPYYMAELGHGMLNPNHVSQWNPMFAMPVQNYNVNPFLTEQGISAAAEYGKNLIAQALDGATYMQNAQNLSAISGQCEALMKDEKLTDEQKAKLKTVQDKAKALQQELKEYKAEMQKQDSDKTALRAKLDKIEKDVKALEKEYVEVVKEIKSELEALAKKEENDKANVEDKDKIKDDKKVDDKAEEKVEDKDKTKVEDKDNGKAEANTVQYSAKSTQSQYNTSKEAQISGAMIAQDVFAAVNGPGTDDEKLETSMEAITKDNVMEVLDFWNTKYAKEFKGESLLESIYDDVFWGNDREKYTRKLMDTLAEKAKDAGVDISADYNQLNEELKAFWRDDKKIYELINKIHKNLGGKEYIAK